MKCGDVFPVLFGSVFWFCFLLHLVVYVHVITCLLSDLSIIVLRHGKFCRFGDYLLIL